MEGGHAAYFLVHKVLLARAPFANYFRLSRLARAVPILTGTAVAWTVALAVSTDSQVQVVLFMMGLWAFARHDARTERMQTRQPKPASRMQPRRAAFDSGFIPTPPSRRLCVWIRVA
jgi:hypothetical protein